MNERKRQCVAVPKQKARHGRFVSGRSEIAWVKLIHLHRPLAVAKPASMKDRLPSFATVPIANL
jgi:hypothetical protein